MRLVAGRHTERTALVRTVLEERRSAMSRRTLDRAACSRLQVAASASDGMRNWAVKETVDVLQATAQLMGGSPRLGNAVGTR